MKLVNKNWTIVIEFEEIKIHRLIIEDKKYFRNIIRSIRQEIDGENTDFIISEKNKPIDFSKYVYLISDIFNMDINSKKLTNEMIKDIKDIALEDYQTMQEIIQKVQLYIDDLTLKSEYPVISDSQINIDSLLKIGGLKIQAYDKFEESILDLLDTSSKLLKIKLFIFLNLDTYFTKDEYTSLIKNFSIRHINVLNITSINTGYKIDKSLEKAYIIDEDFCEI